MFSSLSPARRRLFLGLIAVIAIAALATGVAVIVARSGDAGTSVGGRGPSVTGSGSRGASVAAARPSPVLLVPGYGGATSELEVLASTLRRHGHDATVVGLPGDGRGDLSAQARTVAAAVKAVRQRTGASAVDLVGYSAGGVVVRLWLRDLGGASSARRVITLGSPHHGTDVATLASTLAPDACPIACRQLAVGSALLVGLNAGDETPAGPDYVAIWTTRDQVVVPVRSASLRGAIDMTVQSVCPNEQVGHGSLPSNSHVQSMVLAELGRGPTRRLTSADCGVPGP